MSDISVYKLDFGILYSEGNLEPQRLVVKVLLIF